MNDRQPAGHGRIARQLLADAARKKGNQKTCRCQCGVSHNEDSVLSGYEEFSPPRQLALQQGEERSPPRERRVRFRPDFWRTFFLGASFVPRALPVMFRIVNPSRLKIESLVPDEPQASRMAGENILLFESRTWAKRDAIQNDEARLP